MEKTHSARMREIDRLLQTPREPPSETYVNSKSEVRPSACTLAPPKTFTNRFAGTVPKLDLDPIFGDDMRGVFLTNLPVTERVIGERSLFKSSLLGSDVMPTKTLKLKTLDGIFIRASA